MGECLGTRDWMFFCPFFTHTGLCHCLALLADCSIPHLFFLVSFPVDYVAIVALLLRGNRMPGEAEVGRHTLQAPRMRFQKYTLVNLGNSFSVEYTFLLWRRVWA